MREFVLERAGQIPTPPEGFSLAATTAGLDGAVWCLFVETKEATPRLVLENGVSMPRPRLAQPVAFVVAMTSTPGQFEALGNVDLAHPVFDRLPSGGYALAARRSWWRGPGDDDVNGAILPATGAATRFLAGDGIAHLQADRLGRLWVGYFDEGVFGNNGWGRGTAPPPVGATGLVAFDQTGAIVWQNDAVAIDSCDALNVTAEAAWFHATGDVDLCRVTPDFTVTSWSTGLSGCGAFAVSEDRVLLAGRYREASSQFWVLDLTDDDAGAEPVHVTLSDATQFEKRDLLARGPYLHVMSNGGWYRGDMSAL